VGLSHWTGQITHHIGPDIDAQRNELIADLTKVGRLTKLYQVTGVGATLFGRNGEGDRYFTDGEMTVGVMATGKVESAKPEKLANPPLVQMKDQFWTAIQPLMAGSTP
jgi:hypothetical protein